MPTPRKKKATKPSAGKKPVRKSRGAIKSRAPVASSEPAAAVVKRARAVRPPAGPGRKFAVEAARLMSDLHCENVVLFDTQGKSDVMDYLLIATGTSDRQMRSIGDDMRVLAREHGLSVYGSEADERTTWIVIDLVEVVIHLFEPQTRAYYDLEMMWGDCPQVKWKRS